MTDDLLRSDDQSRSDGESANLQQAEASGALGAEVTLGQAGETVTVTRPTPGQTVEIQAAAGQTYVLSFAPGEAQVQIQGGNFVLAFDDNGDGTPDSQVVFLDLVAVAEAGEAPAFQIAGVDIGSEVLLGQALALAGEGEVPLDDVAAGPGGLGGGSSAYDDNLGSILDLLAAQGVIPPVVLEFGLLELEDRIDILAEADGKIGLTFRTDIDGGEGGSVETWEGGFEDWQPDQDGCDPAEFPMQVVIGFTPADNEELVSFTLSGIPDGAKFYVGGVEVASVDGNTPLLTPADLAAGLHLLPPEDSGDDIPLTVTATISDPDSGDTSVISGSATAIIDSVADNPYAKFDDEADGGEGGCADDCEVIVSSVTYNEDNAEHEVCEASGQVFSQGGDYGGDYGGGCDDCGDDKLSIFGAGFTAGVNDIDGSESLTKIAITTTNECWPTDPNGLEIPLSATDDAAKTNFMIGEQVLEHGQTVEVWAKFPDGTWDFATAEIDITDGVLTLTFAPELRVQELDLSSTSDTPFQVRLPQHSDDDFQLNLEVTAQEFVIDGELTFDNNEATHQAVLNVEVKAVADGASLTAGTDGEGFAEDDESDPANHGEDSGETGLIIPLSSLGAQLVDKDGSEAITELKISLVGADAGAAFVDAEGNPLDATLQVEVAEGVFLTADVNVSGTTLTLTFGDDAAGHDIDLSNLIHVKLPVDDSTDFTVQVQATTTEVNPEGDVACETKTTETSFDVHVGGVAGPAAITFGDYSNIRGCCDPVTEGNTLTLSVYEDGVGSVAGQEGAGPLVVPVFFTAATQDSDGSEKITKVVLSLGGAPEGAVFTDISGEPLTEGQEIAGGTVSLVDGQLIITFPGDGADPIDLAGIGVTLPLHSDDDFAIKIVTTTTEYDDDGEGALVATHETDAFINVKVDAVADPVTVDITVNDSPADDGSQFSPGETGTVRVEATFGDATDGSETHTVTVEIPDGFIVGTLTGLPANVTADVNLDGDVVFTLGSGVTALDYTFEVTAPLDGVDDYSLFYFKATAKAEETPDDAECDPDNNVAEDDDQQLMYGEIAGEPEVGLRVAGESGVKEDAQTDVTITADVTTVGDTLTLVVITAPAGWVLNAAVGGQIASVAGDGTTSLTLTLNPGVTNFSEVIQATPPQDTDIDATFTVSATAVDGLDSAVGSNSFPVAVDAILDHALELGADGAVSGDEADGEQTFGLGLDSSIINPFPGSNDGGLDDDGSESTTVTLTLNAALPDGATLSSTGGTVTATGDPLVFTITGDLEAIIDGLQVTLPGGFEGLISGTITTESREANTPQGTAGGSGLEPDETDNASTDSVTFAVRIAGGKVEPTAALALAGGAAAIKEDSENNVVNVSASANNPTDELTTVVIELPNVAAGDIDIAQILSDLGANGTASVTAPGGLTTITITFNDAANQQSFSSSFTLDAPLADSDVDLADLKIIANAKDITDAGATGSSSQTTTVVVDAILDTAVELGADGSTGGSESGSPQIFGLGLDSSFVGPFAGSGAGGADTDLSETTTVTLTLNEALPDGAVLSSTAGTVSPTGDPLVYTVTGANLEAAIDGLQVQVPGGFAGVISGTISTASAEANTPAGTVPASGLEPDVNDNTRSDSVTFTVTVTDSEVEPEASLALAGGGDCIKEDSVDNVIEFTANSGDSTDELTTVVIELPGVLAGHVGGLAFGADAGKVASTNIVDNGSTTTISITLNPGVESLSGSFTLDAPVVNSDMDITGITITANAQDKTNAGVTGSGGAGLALHVDAVVDGSEVTQTTAAEGDENTTIDLNLAIDLGGDSTTGPGESQGGADKDGSESIDEVVVTLSEGTLGWTLPGAIAAPVQNPAGTWTFDTSGAGLAEVKSLVDSLKVTPPEGFDGDIAVTVTTTTAEAATEAGPNGGSGEECDDSDNVDVDSYDFTVTVSPTVLPPEIDVQLEGNAACIKEDGSVGFDIVVSAQDGTDDVVNAVAFHQFKALQTAGWGVVISDGGAGGSFDGDFNYTADGVDPSVTFTVTLTPPADSDLDVASTLAGLDLAVSATAKDGALVSTVAGPVAIDVNVDAVVDGVGNGLSVNIVSITDSDDANTSFGAGETGKITVLATFGDYLDGSEIHEIIITLPEGFSYDAGVYDLPAGVTYDAGASDDGKAVFKVSSESGPSNVTIELAVTNESSEDSLVQFKAEAKAIETETPHHFPADGECDPSDNLAQVQDTGSVEVESTPVLVVGENTDDEGDETQDHRIENPDGEPDGDIVGNGADDVLVGDVGGGNLINKVMNIALVLDTSGSMDASITFDGQSTTRIQALDKAVETLLDSLSGTSGATVRVHLVSFASDVKEVGTFDIVVDGVVNAAALLAAKNFIIGPGDTVNSVADGNTNYEAGFDAALDWYSNPANTLGNPDFNQTIFISDGEPNRAYEGNGTTSVIAPGNAQDALDHVLGEYDNGNDDTFSEFAALQGVFEGVNGTVDAIGIAVGDSAENRLDQVDDDGDADNISSGEQLLEVLGDLTQVNSLADVGSDSIVGNGGDDLIFGDSVFTDLLAADQGINLPPGSGWAVIQQLVAGGVLFNQDPDKSVNEEIMDFLRDPANQDLYDLARESQADGVGRGGGHDTIDGGAGNDTIHGQEGNDSIVAGTGQDVIAGGTGNDTMTGGTGERDTFRWTAADHGSVTGGVAIYNFAGVTRQTNDHFAWEFDVDNSPNDPTELNGLQESITGYGAANEATNPEYVSLASSDGSHWNEGPGGSNSDDDTQVFWAQFTIDEDVNDITQIDLLIEGRQENVSSGEPAYLAIWNYTDSQWEILDQELTDSDYNFVGSLTGSNIHEYLDDSTKQITFMLMNGDDGDNLAIDYVEAKVMSATGSLEVDTITDFEFTNGVVDSANDVLDLGELLPGSVTGATSAADLTEYLSFTYAGGNTTVHVDHDGGAAFQPTLDIVLVGVDLTNSGAFANDEQIIQALINGNQLAV